MNYNNKKNAQNSREPANSNCDYRSLLRLLFSGYHKVIYMSNIHTIRRIRKGQDEDSLS